MNFWQFLQGKPGELSSKRIVAITSFVVAIFLAFFNYPEIVIGEFLALTAGIFGIQAATKT